MNNTSSDAQFAALKAELGEAHAGAANAGRPLVLEGGLDWKPMSMTPADMDFIAGKHAAAREIDETLPEAIDRLDQRIAASQSVVVAARPELLALVTAAESTHDAIEAIAQETTKQRGVAITQGYRQVQ